ncbi:UPF0236 family protein [Terrilactibacillus sp. S3-3]|nr:UPF0236 family protein [Terrilactibacillus sp. S3-3]
MEIIKDLFDIWKKKKNLIDFETGAVQVMYEWMCQAVGRMLTDMNCALTRLKQKEGWKVERTDERTLQFLFGPVTFSHRLIIAPNQQSVYPLDKLMKWGKGSRFSPYVELKTAQLAGRMPYRQVVETLETWTPIKMSHSTVMASVRRVGAAQGQMDETLVEKDKASRGTRGDAPHDRGRRDVCPRPTKENTYGS